MIHDNGSCAFNQLLSKCPTNLLILTLQDNIPPSGCSRDSDCVTTVCASSTCISGRCSHILQEECCGNLVCDLSDTPECNDCNLSTLDTLPCTECSYPKGVMFDVTSSQDITIESLKVQLSNGINYVVVYMAPGNYSDKVTDPSQWTRVYTNSFAVSGEYKLLAQCIF